MPRILALSLCVLAGALAALVPCTSTAQTLEGRRPNVIFILTDDQGYGDLSVHGNPVLKTPHLDRMHAESVRFTNWYNSPTCAPTRSALLTGRHEFRNGVTHTILERERLRLDSVTLAQVLQKAGYTTGIFGKWHLGDEAEYRPDKRGFDEVFIHGGGGIGQSYPGSCGDAPGNGYSDPAILHNNTFVKTKGYCTDVFFQQATHWIESRKSGEKPFLCWIATNAPHSPYIAKPGDRALYEANTPNEAVANFFGMLHNIDENVGRLLARLDQWGIAEDTLVIFMNDNGGTAGVPVYNAGMRGSKGSPWLGGTRAISFWRWKGTLQPADCGALTAHIDFFRTLTALAGGELDDTLTQQSAEARNLVPLLEKPTATWEDRHLFTHLGRWPKDTPPDAAKLRNASVRNNRYTLVSEVPRGPRAAGTTAAPEWKLFDVQADPGQTTDIAAANPAVVKELTQAYDAWWSSLKGQYDIHESALGPKLNPFAELYWKQFGGGPTPADYERMDPEKAKTFEAGRANKGGAKGGG